jgi:hypothetical protein
MVVVLSDKLQLVAWPIDKRKLVGQEARHDTMRAIFFVSSHP